MTKPVRKRRGLILVLPAIIITSLVIYSGNRLVINTSKNEYCASCHIHPQASQSWKRSTHYDNPSGIQVACVDCHLPPHGDRYLAAKASTGIRDVWGKLFRDPETFNWDAKSRIDYAKGHVYETSCIACHQNNFPIGLTEKGREAHLYYDRNTGEVNCINCHITVGHYDPERRHGQNEDFGKEIAPQPVIYTQPAHLSGFEDFTEYIPGTGVSFSMKAITGGTFTMGSPDKEPFRVPDEGPVAEVTVSDFYIGQCEVSWDEYLAFFNMTGGEGKTTDPYLYNRAPQDVDAISGPTPPYGAPDQGWGKGQMPAITMTHHAASVYCEWLSQVTGKHYRLPTEAEWEYASRGGTSTPYFFEGSPKKFADKGLKNKLFGPDTTVIDRYVNYKQNSKSRPVVAGSKQANPFGLEHMSGNVAEFCSDWYKENIYTDYAGKIIVDPTGPVIGTEYVVRGGSYRDDAAKVRSASRDHTRTTAWLKTDPQIPKSIWWYSDCSHVGFRVVCERDNHASGIRRQASGYSGLKDFTEH